MSDELIKQSDFFTASLTKPIETIKEVGKILADSGMFGIKTAAQGQTIALISLIERRSPLEILGEFHIMHDGKLSRKAESMLKRFIDDGGSVDWLEYSDGCVKAKFKSPSGSEIIIEQNLDQLIKSGVAKDKNGVKATYRQYPRQMLRSRCISEAITTLWPKAKMGFCTPEEMSDIREIDCARSNIIDINPEPEHEQKPVQIVKKTKNNRGDKLIQWASKIGVTELDIVDEFGEKDTWGDDVYEKYNKIKTYIKLFREYGCSLDDLVAKFNKPSMWNLKDFAEMQNDIKNKCKTDDERKSYIKMVIHGEISE